MSELLTLRLAEGAARLQSSEIRDLLRIAESPGVLSLAGGLPAPNAFPRARIAVAAQRALALDGAYGPVALQYGPTEGLSQLRGLLATGTPASPPMGDDESNIIITTGSQQGLELVTRSLVDPGDTVVVEEPAYLGTRQVFAAHGARVVGVPVDEHGMDTDRLSLMLAGGLVPRVVTVVPNFSNPTGATLSPERRGHLAALAQNYGFVVIEDDAYHSLGFNREAATPIRDLAPEHTVLLGSASKVVAPGLRVGWLRAPNWVLPSIVRAKQTLDLHTATLPQLIVADLLADTTFMAEHLRSVRAMYQVRAETLHAAVHDFIDAPMPAGGMFLWGRAAVDTRASFPAAIDAGVAYVPGDAFSGETDGSRALRLSFATLDPEALRAAAARLRTVFASSATTLAGWRRKS